MRGSHLATSREPPGARTNARRQFPPHIHPCVVAKAQRQSGVNGRRQLPPHPPMLQSRRLSFRPTPDPALTRPVVAGTGSPSNLTTLLQRSGPTSPPAPTPMRQTPGGTRLPQRTGHRVTGTPVALVSSPSHFGNANARAPHTLPHRMNNRLRPLPAISTRIRTRDPPSESFRRAARRFARHEDPTTRSSGGPLKPTHIPTTPTNLPNQPIAPAP